MEEEKKILLPEEPNSPNSGRKESLPNMDVDYNENNGDKPGTEIVPLQGRVSNTFMGSIIVTPEKIRRDFNITLADPDVKEACDRDGKIIKPTAFQKRVLLSLGNQLSKLTNTPTVKNHITELEKGNKHGEQIAVFVNIEEMVADIVGKEERWKSTPQKKVIKAMEELSKLKQLQIYKTEYYEEGNKKKPVEVYFKDVFPYLTLTGREQHIQIGKRTVMFLEVSVSNIYLDRIRNRSVSVPATFWEATASNGNRNEISTDEFISLSIMVFDLSWSHYNGGGNNLSSVNKKIKDEGILDLDKIKEMRKEVLTHSPIPFERLIQSLEKSIKFRAQMNRFKKYVWEAMWALIDRGIITEDSRIDDKKRTINLVYSETYGTPITYKPSGYWSKNPYKKEDKEEPGE